MNNIYIVDYLGIHCGMHYYLEAFRQVLSDLPDSQIHILSNYAEYPGEKPFFLNQYKGSILNKGFRLIRNLNRLKNFVKSHPDDIYIYLTYGNSIDIPFINIITRAPRHVIDIHEAIAQHIDSNENLKRKFRKLYSNNILTVISHSNRTDNFLRDFGFNGRSYKVPHFKYIFPKDYSFENIVPTLSSAIDKDKINLLFFGNLTHNKGVDILIAAYNMLSREQAGKLNVIIAGKNIDNSINRFVPTADRNVHVLARHISDDELRFLYQNVDFLALPYRKTSQSGILEMAFYFKRPIIASDAEYFRLTLKEFPSFGVVADGLTSTDDITSQAHAYAEKLSHIISNGHNPADYFTDADYRRYQHRAEIKEFVKEFQSHLK